MSEFPAHGSAAPLGLLGVLRSWLQARHIEAEPLPALHLHPGRRPQAHSYGSARVLVVDDNPVNLMVISAALESRGLVPVLAADGAEAVALAGELQFDLILMDLQMPILDGLGATSAIRRFERDHARVEVPVIAFSSACPAPGVLARHGLNGSLGKPCEDRDLEQCLVNWCPTYRSAAQGVDDDHRPWPPAGPPSGPSAGARTVSAP